MTARDRDLRVPMTTAELLIAGERATAAGMDLAPMVRRLLLQPDEIVSRLAALTIERDAQAALAENMTAERDAYRRDCETYRRRLAAAEGDR